MTNDRQIIISTGTSRKSVNWYPQTLYWSEFVGKLSSPVRTTETYDEYSKLSKAQQDDLKNVGGFVGGKLSGQRRKADSVEARYLVTLDADNIPAGETQTIIDRVSALGCAYAIYSTRKHCGAKPRLRIIFPLDQPCTADEYEPIARKLASYIGMSYCDPTTFEACRLMYWPSASADGEFVSCYEDKPWVSADGLLAQYADWRNVADWPQVPGAAQIQVRAAKRQGDPLQKSGTVGAFCRTYDIPAAIDKFLNGVYGATDDGRYTFLGGSTVGGAVLYEDGQFLYSHHATDPCSGKLVNSFDLIRLHLFGDRDDEAKPGTPTNQLPSYKAMLELAASDRKVADLRNRERAERTLEAFGGESAVADDIDWMQSLALHEKTGAPLKTTDNILLILEHDPNLKGCVSHDELKNRPIARRDLPWRKLGTQTEWTDTDDAGLRHYLEKVYEITGKDRIYDGFALAAQRHPTHEIRDYLKALRWDGVKRLDTLFIDYLGAADSEYTRAVTRKTLTAAVARVMCPGIKFDYTLVLTGKQGTGKSTALKILGGDWHNDSVTVFKGKEVAELIQGYWIIELGELAGMNKAEVNDVKQLATRREDVYREAYGRHAKPYPRQCIFIGTTNDHNYLRDHTGGRRWWPLDLDVTGPTKSVFKDLAAERDQIWAEAFVCWQCGEKLYLEGAAEEEAKVQQEDHREISPREGIIREFVERKLPEDWQKRTLAERLTYWGNAFGAAEGSVERDRICAAEVWCEAFKGDIKQMQRKDAVEINSILENLDGWERDKTSARYGTLYGLQRGFRRIRKE